jgi:hypothetical protein
MLTPNSYRTRSLQEIVGQDIESDAIGHLHRSMSWLAQFEKKPAYPAFLYACIEARMGLEYLLFEELILSTGAKLTHADYNKCLKDRKKIAKLIKQHSPDLEKLQSFTKAVAELMSPAPRLICWNPKEIERVWGTLSNYVHWSGSKILTTENRQWVADSFSKVKALITPIWEKIVSGQSGLLHPTDMNKTAHAIWTDFQKNKINIASVKVRLRLMQRTRTAKLIRGVKIHLT